MVAAVETEPVFGSALPRLAPPPPLRHRADDLIALARTFEQPFYPWQEVAAKYLMAETGSRWTFPEVAIIVARQNGKTTLLDALITERLRAGRRVMHTAQNRDLPRETHERLAELLEAYFPDELEDVKYGSGKEGIKLTSGGVYRIVAPTRGGARGPANDLVIVDEVREMQDFDFIKAAKPTLTASRKPQMVYLSNAGDALSIVLNSIRDRSGTDPALAYLEWSADRERAPDDMAGWLEANPSIGHNPDMLETLEGFYRSDLLGGTMANWEQEHLCRWTLSRNELLVTASDWVAQRMLAERPKPLRPVLGVKMDPSGDRVSGVLAWPGEDETVTMDVVLDAVGDPIDLDLLLPDLVALVNANRVQTIAFDPATDEDLVRNLTQRMHPITGREYASATERFTRLVAGRKLTVHDPDAIIAADLEHTTRRVLAAGTSIAVKAGAEMTNTAAEAAIRAVWAAAAPQPRPMFT